MLLAGLAHQPLKQQLTAATQACRASQLQPNSINRAPALPAELEPVGQADIAQRALMPLFTRLVSRGLALQAYTGGLQQSRAGGAARSVQHAAQHSTGRKVASACLKDSWQARMPCTQPEQSAAPLEDKSLDPGAAS